MDVDNNSPFKRKKIWVIKKNNLREGVQKENIIDTNCGNNINTPIKEHALSEYIA